MSAKIAVLPGDGIGPEIVGEAMKVLDCLRREFGVAVETEQALVGGVAYDAVGHPLPRETLQLAKAADAVLLGAVGGPKWEPLDYSVRPERALLGLRSELGLFANLRPAVLHSQLIAASTLKPEIIEGLDLLIVRELTGDVYFGKPRGIRTLENGERVGINTMVYNEREVRRIAKVAFELAGQRKCKLCSVDKANVLESTELWRQVVTEVGKDYPKVALTHMYVDNAAMQLVRAPKQFDVILTTNLFGDILSDCAAMLTGSIGMLPSASLNESGKGMYEPIHGSAPDIAGKNLANPLATILSLAMLFRYTLRDEATAVRIERAVEEALDAGVRTADIYSPGTHKVSTSQMGDQVVACLRSQAS